MRQSRCVIDWIYSVNKRVAAKSRVPIGQVGHVTVIMICADLAQAVLLLCVSDLDERQLCDLPGVHAQISVQSCARYLTPRVGVLYLRDQNNTIFGSLDFGSH